MGDGILDFLENKWASLLGAQTPTAGTAVAGPSPLPGPNANNMVGPGNPTGAPPMAPATPQQNYSMAQAGFPTPPPPQAFSGQPFSPSGAVGPNPLSSLDQVAIGEGVTNPPVGNPPPMDQTLANMQPGASGTPQSTAGPPPLPPGLTVGANPSTPAGPGAPLNIAPDPSQFLPPNSTSTAGAPSPTAPLVTSGPGGGGLLRQLGGGGYGGILPTAAAALGKGLTAVGAQPAGTNAAAAFAGGAGGALTGGSNFQQEQQKDAMAQHKQFFDETIASDNQSMKGLAFPYTIAHLAASTGLLNAQQTKAAVNGGSNAWQLSDVGRMRLADQETDTWYKQQIQGLTLRKGAGASDEDIQAKLAQIDAQKEKVQQQNYQKYNINPKTAKGVSQDQPIDATKMGLSQMQSMPAGTWFSYTDKDGKQQVTTRKADEFNTPQMAQQPQQQQPVPYALQQDALGATAGQ